MQIETTKDPDRIDVEKVHGWLSESYWAATRTLEEQRTGMANSINYGAYVGAEMVGFARVVTDRSTFAWICDVIVDPQWRGKGIGTALMDTVFQDPEISAIKRFLLGTRDAHALYQKYGFEATEPGRIMRRGFKPFTPNTDCC